MKKKIAIFTLIIICVSLYLGRSSSFARKNYDLMQEVLQLTSADIEEYGVKVSFESQEIPEDYCLNIFKKLNISGGEVSIVKKDENYCLEFNNNEMKGYIESTSYDNHNVVTLNLIKYGNENEVSNLLNMVKQAVGKNQNNLKEYRYAKARLKDGDKESINDEIIQFLTQQKSSNIDTVEIENGFSTVAYTKQYTPIKNNGKLIDFNFAVCSYTSGNYLIIGTPIIVTTY